MSKLHKFRSAPILLVILTLLFGFTLSLIPTKQADAAYNGANIISNFNFLDAGSMDASSIQSFLVSKNSGLATRSFPLTCYGSGSREWQIYTSIGAPCGQTVQASQIIYYAAQVYGMSPKVILATLQKEQSLITTANPTSWQINQAMGYNCPTTGSCDDNSNFFYQIDSGVWVFRFHYERANGNFNWWTPSSGWVCGTEKNFYKPSLFPYQNVQFFDGNGTHYRTYWLENAATSSLYCYTPHAYNNPQGLYNRAPYGTTGQYYSGSYNFVSAYESWFGPTTSTALIQGSGSTVYLVNASTGTRFGVPSVDMLANYGMLSTNITPVSDSYINSLTDGGTLGTLFSLAGDPTVYVADAGTKYGIPSGEVCTHWKFDCSNGVKQIGSDVASRLRNGKTLPLLMNYYSKIYKITDGVRRPYLSQAALNYDGKDGNSAVTIWSPHNTIQSKGAPIIEPDVLVKFGTNPTLYFYTHNKFYQLANYSTYAAWFPGSGAYQDQISSYADNPPAPADTIRQYFRDNNNKTYLINARDKVDIAATAAHWPSPLVASDFNTYINSLPTRSVDGPQYTYRTPNGAIYVVKPGGKSTILSMDDFWGLGYSSSNTVNVGAETLSEIPNGQPAIGEGSIFKVTGSAQIYLRGRGNSVYRINSMAQLGQLRITKQAHNLSPQILSAYDLPKAFSNFVLIDDSGNNYAYLTSDGHLWSLGAAQRSQWGIGSSNLSNNAIRLTSNLAPLKSVSWTNRSLPAFAHYNGRIYYGSGGQKRLITSYDKYLALGGNSSNTFNATVDFLDACPTGSDI